MLIKLAEILTIYLVFYGIIQIYKSYTKNKVTKLSAQHKVADVMHRLEELLYFDNLDTLKSISEKVIRSYQTYFPVLKDKILIGIVTRDEIISRMVMEPNQYVSNLVLKDIPSIEPETPLEKAYLKLNKVKLKIMTVILDGIFIGLLIEDKVEELILLQNLKTLNDENL